MTEADRVEAAIQEAERFLDRARDYLTEMAGKRERSVWPSTKRAAMRRASMDLTRSLSQLRASQ